MDFVKDPKVYPVVFTLDRRELSIVDNKTSDVTFMASTNKKIKNAFYFYDGNYIIDVDTTSSSNMTFVGDGKEVIFEFLADSTTLESANFNLKVWRDVSSSVLVRSGENINLRQIPWSEVDTVASFYSSNSMKQFNPVVVGDIPYYPSVKVKGSFYPEYYSFFPINSFEIYPGSQINRNVIDKLNFGILTIIFNLSVVWYYDRERTLPVSTPPSELQFSNKYFSTRMFFVKSGKFIFRGNVDSKGVAVFDGILTQNYVLSHSLNYGSFCFTGINSNTNALFFGMENEVIIDENGYCAKEERISQIYICPFDDIIIINADEVYDVGRNNANIIFTGEVGHIATVIVNEVSFIVKNNFGSFVWDFGGSGEHTFTYVGEMIERLAGGYLFTVTWDGSGSLLFSVNFI